MEEDGRLCEYAGRYATGKLSGDTVAENCPGVPFGDTVPVTHLGNLSGKLVWETQSGKLSLGNPFRDYDSEFLKALTYVT